MSHSSFQHLENDARKDNPRRPRLPFGLNSLLLACAIAAAFALWMKIQWPVDTEERALQFIRSRGATVVVSANRGWLAGERRIEIAMTGSEFDDEDVRLLPAVTSLRRLDLRDSLVTDRCAAVLSKLPWLESLDVTDTAVSDAGLKQLKSALPNCKITAQQHVEGLQTLLPEDATAEVILENHDKGGR